MQSSTTSRLRDSHSDASAGDKMIKVTPAQRPFTRTNFIMMGVCLLMIVAGFLLMSGGGSSIEKGFNPDIFSTRRIVVGPAVAFLGFLLMAFAIVWTPGRRAAGDRSERKED